MDREAVRGEVATASERYVHRLPQRPTIEPMRGTHIYLRIGERHWPRTHRQNSRKNLE